MGKGNTWGKSIMAHVCDDGMTKYITLSANLKSNFKAGCGSTRL